MSSLLVEETLPDGEKIIYDVKVLEYYNNSQIIEIDMLRNMSHAMIILNELYELMAESIGTKDTNTTRRLITIRFTVFNNNDEWVNFVNNELHSDKKQIETYFNNINDKWHTIWQLMILSMITIIVFVRNLT